MNFGKETLKIKENYRKLLMDEFLYLYERLMKTWAAKPKLHVLNFKILMYVKKKYNAHLQLVLSSSLTFVKLCHT